MQLVAVDHGVVDPGTVPSGHQFPGVAPPEHLAEGRLRPGPQNRVRVAVTEHLAEQPGPAACTLRRDPATADGPQELRIEERVDNVSSGVTGQQSQAQQAKL